MKIQIDDSKVLNHLILIENKCVELLKEILKESMKLLVKLIIIYTLQS